MQTGVHLLVLFSVLLCQLSLHLLEMEFGFDLHTEGYEAQLPNQLPA